MYNLSDCSGRLKAVSLVVKKGQFLVVLYFAKDSLSWLWVDLKSKVADKSRGPQKYKTK